MATQSPTNPLAFVTLGAAAAALSRLGLPQGLFVSAAVATLVYAAVRRTPVRQHLGAVVVGGACVMLISRLMHTGVAGLLGTLVVIGVIAGGMIGRQSPPAGWPRFRFLREDFFEFCGFVGVLAAFPAVLAFGVTGAADWVGRIAFELAFLGFWVLLPMSAAAHGVGRLVRARRARTNPVTDPTASDLPTSAT